MPRSNQCEKCKYFSFKSIVSQNVTLDNLGASAMGVQDLIPETTVDYCEYHNAPIDYDEKECDFFDLKSQCDKKKELNEDIEDTSSKQVSGWLAFFLWVGVGLGAIIGTVKGVASWGKGELTPYSAIVFALCCGSQLVVAALTIIAFYKQKNNAVSLALTYLGMVAVGCVLCILMTVIIDDNSYLSEAIRSFIWTIVWFLYLMCSTQVNKLIPVEMRKTKPLEIVLLVINIVMSIIIFIEVDKVHKHPSSSNFYSKEALIGEYLKVMNQELARNNENLAENVTLENGMIVYHCRYMDISVLDTDKVRRDYNEHVGLAHKQELLKEYAFEYIHTELNNLFFSYGNVQYQYTDQDYRILYTINITPEEYESALEQGRDFKCDPVVLKQLVEYYNNQLPMDFLIGTLQKAYVFSNFIQFDIALPEVSSWPIRELSESYLENYLKKNMAYLTDFLCHAASINQMEIHYCFETCNGQEYATIVIPYEFYCKYL